jgi:plastocyanin domain-containing protein
MIALVMMIMGLKLIGLFSFFNRFELALPKWVLDLFALRERSEEKYSSTKTMILGALTFFVPCGFTQAMQLYALSSGSALTGAVTMGLFALGTAPGLLALGGLVSIVKGKWSSVFFRLAGIAVLAFALFNLRNGWNLLAASGFAWSQTKSVQVEESSDKEEQIIRMTQTARGYSPKNFTVEAGRPVKWIIDSQNANTCAASIVAPKINVKMQLKAGENIIRFTPTEIGTINFTCSMGMYRGTIEVVEKKVGEKSSSLGVTEVQAADNEVKSKKEKVKSSVTAVDGEEVKVLKTSYTLAGDIQPSEFVTKVGQRTRIEVLVKEAGEGCMRDIMIQGLAETPQYLAEGETIKMEFTPTKAGRYLIVCAMNIPRGVVVVE